MEAGEILKACANLRTLVMDRLQLIAANQTEMKRLDAAGRIYATPHWRDGRYLYLLHPTDTTGRRQRKYIGAQPEKVAAALTQVNNARQYDELRRQTDRAEAALRLAEHQIRQAIGELSRAAPLDLATVDALNGDSGAPPGRPPVPNGLDSPLVTGRALEQLQLSPI